MTLYLLLYVNSFKDFIINIPLPRDKSVGLHIHILWDRLKINQ